jgi:hypothetical protein
MHCFYSSTANARSLVGFHLPKRLWSFVSFRNNISFDVRRPEIIIKYFLPDPRRLSKNIAALYPIG